MGSFYAIIRELSVIVTCISKCKTLKIGVYVEFVDQGLHSLSRFGSPEHTHSVISKAPKRVVDRRGLYKENSTDEPEGATQGD